MQLPTPDTIAMTRRFFLAVICTYCIFAGAERLPAQSKSTVVILVRHGEKAAAPAADPPLTEAGVARARALAAALSNTVVQAAITTEFARTRETAQPTVDAQHLTPEIVRAGPVAAHAKAVADAVRAHAGQTVLVVGHSNTVPAIIAALGGPKLPDICDSQYSNFFVLILHDGKADLITSSYGASSADPATTCPNSMK
jgi:phosphohistidine phosphatase SixA